MTHTTNPPREAEQAAPDWRRIRFWVLVALVFGVGLVFNVLTPLVADDWGRAATMTSLGQVISESWDFYLNWDGRLINSLLGNAGFLMPAFAFDVVNAAMFTALILIVYKMAAPRGVRSASLLLVAAALVWLYVPAFGQVVLWQLGSAIYLWAAVQILLVIWLFQRFVERGEEPPGPPVLQAVSMFVIGLVAGNAAQNGSAGAMFILTGLVVAARLSRGRIPAWMIAGWAGGLLGFAAVVFAPGNSTRDEALTTTGLDGLRGLASHVELLLAKQYAEMGNLVVLTVVLFVAYACSSRREWQRLVVAGLLITASYAVVFVMLAAPQGAASLRTFSFSAFFLITAAVVLLSSLAQAWKEGGITLRRVVAAGLIVLAGYSLVPALYDAGLLWSADRERIAGVERARDAGKRDVKVDLLPVPRSKYRADFQLGDVTDDPSFWRNRGLAQYLGVESVAARPTTD